METYYANLKKEARGVIQALQQVIMPQCIHFFIFLINHFYMFQIIIFIKEEYESNVNMMELYLESKRINKTESNEELEQMVSLRLL